MATNFNSCRETKKSNELPAQVDTIIFRGMNPDSVFVKGYEYYLNGDDKNWEIVKSYLTKKGSKLFQMGIAIDKIRDGNTDSAKVILKKLMNQNFGQAYAEYGLLLLKENSKDYLKYLDTAISLKENYLNGFLGELFLDGNCYFGGVKYEVDKDTILGLRYAKLDALDNSETQLFLGRYYFIRNHIDSSLRYYKMCLTSDDEDIVTAAKSSIEEINKIKTK